MSDKSLVLVDGSSYLYRAFHALPDLRSPAGEPTGAIYGVLNMLRRLVNDYKADFLGCVFDAKGKTFRDEVYPEYKANRQAMPDELAAQIEPLMEAIRAMGWPLLVVDGVEADDVIATLAREATNAGLRTVISTGDKDLAQLVDPRVTLINTMSNETLDIAGVKAKFGVAPEKIVDYLALVGDSVDNIPGVDKVGPKTAAKWIAQYGSLEGVLAHADEITGVVGENLRKVRDWLGTARELVTVKSDVELPFKVVDLAPRERDRQQLAALFQRFGFKSWLKEVQEERETPVPAAPAMPAAPVIAPARTCRASTKRCRPKPTWRGGSSGWPVPRSCPSTPRPPRSIRSRRSSWASRSRPKPARPRTSPSTTATRGRRTSSASSGRWRRCGRGSKIRRGRSSARG